MLQTTPDTEVGRKCNYKHSSKRKKGVEIRKKKAHHSVSRTKFPVLLVKQIRQEEVPDKRSEVEEL